MIQGGIKVRSLMPRSPKTATIHGALGDGAIAWVEKRPKKLVQNCPSPRRPMCACLHWRLTTIFAKEEPCDRIVPWSPKASDDSCISKSIGSHTLRKNLYDCMHWRMKPKGLHIRKQGNLRSPTLDLATFLTKKEQYESHTITWWRCMIACFGFMSPTDIPIAPFLLFSQLKWPWGLLLSRVVGLRSCSKKPIKFLVHVGLG